MTRIFRPEMANLFFFLSAVFLFVGIEAKECSTECRKGTKSINGFLKDYSYTYTFNGTTIIHLSGANDQETGASIQAVATVFGLGDCSNVLKITHLKYLGPNETEYESPDEITKSIRFSMQDGVIGTEICTEEDDSQTSLNIKRAILSLLQLAQKKQTEVDIYGECETSFFVDGRTVQKRKDLNACTGRRQNGQNLLNQIYNADSHFKTKHVMKANLKVDMVLNSGIVEQAESREEYIFVPFSNRNAGAKAIVTSKLQLTETTKGTLQSNCVEPKTIVFGHPLMKTTHGNVENIHKALLFVTEHLEGHVHPDSASLFVDLIRLLRSSSENDISKVLDGIKSEKKSQDLLRKVLIDALIRTGTSNSMGVLIEFLKHDLDPLERKLILGSFTGIRHVTFDTVKAAGLLLRLPDLPTDVYLSVGSIVGSYCKEHPCHGESFSPSQREAIVFITEHMVKKLGHCKASTIEKEDEIVAILRALKNMHHLEHKAVLELTMCAFNRELSSRIRVTTLEVFATDACVDQLKKVLLTILENRNEDSEIRIKAYLALLQCPCNKFVTVIQNILDHPKPSLQVGSFIASSLRNILTSDNPSTEEARKLFGNLSYNNSYPIDPRKYSQAYEMKFGTKRSGFKSLAQSNVIYSQKSFLPKSLNLNLTGELFGSNVNLLEIGVRQDNLERILEEYFGPQGELHTYEPQTFYNKLNKTVNDIYNDVQFGQDKNGQKTKRDTESNAISTKVGEDMKKYRQHVGVDLFVKLFGSDALFLSLGDNSEFSFVDLSKRFFNSMDTGTNGAQKFLHEVRSHNIFLDLELSYPTMTGLPLKVNVEGALTSKLTFRGEFDMQQVFNDVLNSKLAFTLMPSASIQIIGALSTDADVFATGLKVVTTLHTSTGVECSAKVSDNGKGFDMELGVPLEKQEFVTATNEIMFFTRKVGDKDIKMKLKFQDDWRYNRDDDNVKCLYTANYDGSNFNLCFDSDMYFWNIIFGKGSGIIKPTFPLSGQKKIIVFLPKMNTLKYQLKGMTGDLDNKKFWEIYFETKVTDHNTRWTARMEYDNNGSLVTSIMYLHDMEEKGLIFGFVDTSHEKSFSITWKGHYRQPEDIFTESVKIGVLIDQLGSKIAYQPIFNFTNNRKIKPDEDIFETRGFVYVEPVGDKLNYTIDGLGYTYGKEHSFNINGWSLLEYKSVSWDVSLALRYHERQKSILTIGNIYNDYDIGLNTDVLVEFVNDYDDDFNFRYYQNINSTRNLDDSIVSIGTYVFSHGPDGQTKEKNLTFSTYTMMKDVTEFVYHTKQELSYPRLNLKHRGELEYKELKKIKFAWHGEHMKEYFDFTFDMDDTNTKNNEKYGKLKIDMNKEGVELYLFIQEETEEKTNVKSHVVVLPNDKYEFSASIAERWHASDDFKINFNSNCQFPESKIYGFEVGYTMNPNEIVSNAVLARAEEKLFDFKTNVDLEKMFGDLNLVISDIAVVKGEYKLKIADNTINSVVNIDIKKIDKMVQVETNFVYNQPKYAVELKIFPNYGKDKSLMYRITTATSIKDNDVDSKNIFYNGDRETKLNFIIKSIGNNYANGKTKFGVELTESTGVSYAMTYDDEINSYDMLVNDTVNVLFKWTDANAANPRKLTTQWKMINYNEEMSSGITTFKSIYLKENGDDLIYSYQTVMKDKGSNTELEFTTSLGGAMVQNAVDLYTFIDFKKQSLYSYNINTDYNYKVRASYGKETSVEGSGTCTLIGSNYFFRKYIVNADIEAHLPLQHLKTLKLNTKNSVIVNYDYIPQTDGTDVKTFLSAVINDNNYVYEFNLQKNKNVYATKMALEIPENEPFLLELCINQTDAKNGTVGNKLNTDMDFFLKSHGQNLTYTFNIHRYLSLESGGDIDSLLILPEFMTYHRIKSHCVYSFQSSALIKFRYVYDLDIDGKKYSHTADVNINPSTSIVDLKASYPDETTSRLYVRATNMLNDEFDGHAIIQNIEDFNLDLLFNGKVKPLMDFDVKMDVDYPKLDMVKCHLEAIIAPLQPGEHELKILITMDGKAFFSVIIAVNDSFVDDTLTVSGSGEILWKGVELPATFTFTRNFYVNGISTEFYGKVGFKTLRLHHINDASTYLLSVAQCGTVLKCAHTRFYVDESNIGNEYRKYINMEWDFKTLGFDTTFVASSKMVEGKNATSHDVYMEFERKGSVYRCEYERMPINETYKMVTQIKIPSRSFSVETIFSDRSNTLLCSGKPFVNEIIFHWNTSDPTSKTHFKSSFACHKDLFQQSLNGSLSFVYPGAPKEMSMDLKSNMDLRPYKTDVSIDLDIFQEKDKRFSINGTVIPHKMTSVGVPSGFITKLNIEGVGHRMDYEAYAEYQIFNDYEMKFEVREEMIVEYQNYSNKVHLTLQPKLQKFMVVVPAGNVLSMENSIDFIKQDFPSGVQWKSNIKLLDNKRYNAEGKVSICEGLRASWEGGYIEPAEYISMEAFYTAREGAELHANYTANDENHDIFTLGYTRHNNSLPFSTSKVDIHYLKKSLEAPTTYWKSFSTQLLEYREKSSEIENNITTRLADIIWDSLPDMGVFYFEREMKAIDQEVKDDEFLSLMVIPLKLFLTVSDSVIENVVLAITKTAVMVIDILEDLSERTNSYLLNTAIYTVDKIGSLYTSAHEKYVMHSEEIVAYIADYIEVYASMWISINDELYTASCESYNKVCEFIKSIFDALPTYIEQLTLPFLSTNFNIFLPDYRRASHHLFIFVLEITGRHFEEILPTKEWEDFCVVLIKYHEQPHNGELSNDKNAASVHEIVKKGKLLVAGVLEQMKGKKVSKKYIHLYSSLLELIEDVEEYVTSTNLLKLLNDLKMYIQNIRFPDFDIQDVFPPYDLKGFIAGGHHMFTFDGGYLHFPQDCDFEVAHDSVDGNFSITMKQHGNTKSLLFIDADANVVEVNNEGKIFLDGPLKGLENNFPILSGDVQGYRKGNTFILKSKYGVFIKCTKVLSFCYFKTSGYYFGKLRGLLGDGNNEPADDHKDIEGQIIDSESDARSMHALKTNCPKEDFSNNAVGGLKKDEPKSEPIPSICTDIFEKDLQFSYCKAVVDVNPYKRACSEAYEVSPPGKEASSAACQIAMSYALACKYHDIPFLLPEVCVSCNLDGHEYKSTDKGIDIEVPDTQADIVLVVDAAEINEKVFKELVTPMITKVIEELKNSKIEDVKIYLARIRQNSIYPVYYDVENQTLAGNKIPFENPLYWYGELTDSKLTLHTNNTIIDEYIDAFSRQTLANLHHLFYEVRMHYIQLAYYSLNELPLRPKAAKSLIMVNTEPCQSGFLANQAYHYIQHMMLEEGIVAHLISPVIYKKTNMDYKDYVGFNNNAAFILNNNNGEHLKKGLSYEKDKCIDFALSTFGNVYSTNFFNTMDEKRRDQYISLAAETITSSMAKVSYEKNCKCEIGIMKISPKIKCKIVSRNGVMKPKSTQQFTKVFTQNIIPYMKYGRYILGFF